LSKLWQILLQSKWSDLCFRWFLGLTFIYASTHKIANPTAFAKIVYGYGLFPGEWINLIAIVLPHIELVAGFALVLGLWRRSAALIIVGMLIAFITVISINMGRGYEFDCGCFSKSTETFFLLSGSKWATLVRDMFLLVVGLLILKIQKSYNNV
jgi:uncharacterized membrane protein YphA (DoxX/SURF4 family)